LSSHLRLGLQSGLFPSYFSNNSLNISEGQLRKYLRGREVEGGEDRLRWPEDVEKDLREMKSER